MYFSNQHTTSESSYHGWCHIRHSIYAFLILVVLSLPSLAIAQDVQPIATNPEELASLSNQLNDLADLIDRRTKQRDELENEIADAKDGSVDEEIQELSTLNRDLAKLRESFHFLALGVSEDDVSLEETDQNTTWQEDVVDIIKPVTDSIKSLTEKPRRVALITETIESIEQRRTAISLALENAENIQTTTLDTNASSQLTSLLEKWRDQDQQLEQEFLIAQAQLNRINADNKTLTQGFLPSTRAFFLGRGLTILLALFAAGISWIVMRVILWAYTRFFTSKKVRRQSTWFRVLTYSYYILTILVITFAVLAVLYMRGDLLLLALAFLFIAGAALSFRHFLPRYITEARLLLNIGGVREDERIVFNGLPWQIMSLNLYSVLRNPALDGVIRLPLETMATLVSRPVKHKLWFPTDIGDYVILPNEVFGRVKQQTPDLVEVIVKGGMSQTFPTADFYSMNVLNLSREGTFGVALTFGLDYGLQKLSLDEIPATLNTAIRNTFKDNGYEEMNSGLVVELSEANASSLDFIIFATMDSKVASDYYKIGRLLTQACVATSNERGWSIPFPQLTVHQTNDEAIDAPA